MASLSKYTYSSPFLPAILPTLLLHPVFFSSALCYSSPTFAPRSRKLCQEVLRIRFIFRSAAVDDAWCVLSVRRKPSASLPSRLNCLSDAGCQRAWQRFSPTFAIRFKKIKSSKFVPLLQRLALQSASAESLPSSLPSRLTASDNQWERECPCVLVLLPVHQRLSSASSILPFFFFFFSACCTCCITCLLLGGFASHAEIIIMLSHD